MSRRGAVATAEQVVSAEVGIQDVAAKIATLVEKRQAKPGKLGLPMLLDERRIKYAIPDEAFDFQCAFDRILVYQVPLYDGNTYGKDSLIQMAATTQRRLKEEAPRGVIVSAGLSAMDTLASNGMQVGHIVRFVRMAPWVMPIAKIEGYDLSVLVLRDGDIIASEDLMSELKSKTVSFSAAVNDKGVREHGLVDKAGKRWTPINPWVADDY